MIYDRAFFDDPVNRIGTRSVKWDEQSFCRLGDLPLWVADWDFRCAEPIVEAIQKRAQHPIFGYSSSDPNDANYFCRYWKRRHGLDILPEETCMLPCVVTGLRQAVLLFTEPNDTVIIVTPLYGPFHDSITRAGRRILAAPLIPREDNGYNLDLDLIEDHLKSGCKLILFCNPHNPVSRAWRREELSSLVALANRYEAILVSDEIHADFVYKPLEFIPMLSIQGAETCVISLASASKTFNMPGLQQAMAVSKSKDLLVKLRAQIELQGITSGNIFALAATQAAYTECDSWLDGLLNYLDESREIIKKSIAEELPYAKLTPIEATALAWIDLRYYASTCEELNKKLRSSHVVLSSGTGFDAKLGQGFMRLNFGCTHANLREGIHRMSDALTK